MQTVISQPRFLPSLGYIDRFSKADCFVYLDVVQYTPRDWENRNRILEDGAPRWISVPVKKMPRETPLSEIEIDYSTYWQRKVLNTISHAYAKAPNKECVLAWLSEAFANKTLRLIDLNTSLTQSILDWLGISCRIEFASRHLDGSESTGQELLIALCKKLGTHHYLSGPLGRNYLNESAWQKEGIKLSFLENYSYAYEQQQPQFVPHLSCIDLLIRFSRDECRALMGIDA